MKPKGSVKMTGIVDIYLNDKLESTHNMVVDGGKDWVAQMMNGASTKMTTMQVGTSDTAEDASQSTLITPTGSQVALDGGQGVVTDNQIVYTCTFQAGVSGSVTPPLYEAGIFNAALTMLARTKFGGPIAKDVDDIVTIVWTITVS